MIRARPAGFPYWRNKLVQSIFTAQYCYLLYMRIVYDHFMYLAAPTCTRYPRVPNRSAEREESSASSQTISGPLALSSPPPGSPPLCSLSPEEALSSVSSIPFLSARTIYAVWLGLGANRIVSLIVIGPHPIKVRRFGTSTIGRLVLGLLVFWKYFVFPFAG